MSVELTVTIEVVIRVEHDGPTEGYEKAKYDALLKGGLIMMRDNRDLMNKLSECIGSGREADLGYVDDNVAYMATEVLDATILKIQKVE
jgi:hypothetical protein